MKHNASLSPCFSRPDARRRGISLIEIMVVLVIMSIMLIISIPVMRGTHERNKLAAAARDFCTMARYARAQASLEGKTVEIRIDLEKGRYYLEENPEPDRKRARVGGRRRNREGRPEYRYLDDKHSRIQFDEIRAAAELDADSQMVRLQFFRDGSATYAAILIRDEKERAMTVEIAGASGAVRTYKGEPKPIEVVEYDPDKEESPES
ncbi:MAG: Tfp pilus assembly protein FimT/FimU [Candidatus Sumerlaeia bacterium]